MCTAATYLTDHFFFGRNLDYERGFGERVTVTPRSFPLPMRHLNEVTQHYAMIGMASVQAGYPLYYDAVNEKGLCIAGLNFVSSAVYRPCPAEGRGVAQFELIPWLLGSCASVDEACALLDGVCITDDAFLPGLPPAKLHCSVLAEEGIKSAIADYYKRQGIDPEPIVGCTAGDCSCCHAH